MEHLKKLIQNSESMDDFEKKVWISALPDMEISQKKKLKDILETERRMLAELEVKFQEENRNLNEKHLIEWQEFQSQVSRKKLT